MVPGAPGFFHHLVGMDGAQRSLATVRLLTSGTAPLDTDDFGAVQTLIGQPVWEGYGLSEAASVVASTLMTDEPRHGSVGQAAVRYRAARSSGRTGRTSTPTTACSRPTTEPAEPQDPLDVMVEAPDAGEVGRIAIRGATLFSGYWPDGGGGPGADGWFVTGDIGFLDDDGELHLVDRASETVTVAGFTVYPREVEQVLGTASRRRRGRRDRRAGGGRRRGGRRRAGGPRRTRCSPRPISPSSSASRLPAFKRPVVYQLAPSLPRTEVGRLDRGCRAAQLRLDAERDAAAAGGGGTLAGWRGTVNGDQARAVDGDPTRAERRRPWTSRPEQVADLDELGVRLPASGNREERGDQDTDEDLF